MASRGASEGPAASSAAALRRALLLPLALSTSTGIVALALTEHVHGAVTRQNADEQVLRAIDCLHRGVLDENALYGKSGSTDAGDSCGLLKSVTLLEEAAQKQTPIAGRLRSVNG